MRTSRAERYRAAMRAHGREGALRVADKVRGMLDNYVLARRGELLKTTEIRWDRILVTVIISIIILTFITCLIIR
jgi:hypothetical protein